MRRAIVAFSLLLTCAQVAAQVSPAPGIDVKSVPTAPGVYTVRATNHWWGPVQVQIKLGPGAQNVQTSVNLPYTWEVPSRASKELLKVSTKNPAQPGSFGLDILAVPGSHYARHRADYAYQWPLPPNEGRMDQGFGGTHSHADLENYYAVDIAAPAHTLVKAARPGIVMATEGRFTRGGTDPELKTQANYVRILQNDGSMAVYVHLAPNSIKVRPGQAVNAGQPLGEVGQTGFASGTHLHFAIQVNTGMALRSVPFKMYQPKGVAAGLDPARDY